MDGTFTIGIYRKAIHTELYLPWDSNHYLAAMYSVIKNLNTQGTYHLLNYKIA